MDTLAEKLPEIIGAAAQSNLGILALLSIVLSVLAYFFFAKASEKARVGVFVLLFFGVVGFGAAMFQTKSEPAEKKPLPAPAPVPVVKMCRDKSHGVESYGRTFDTERSSSWMGGGLDQPRWCNQVIATLLGEHPEGAFEVVTSSERTQNTCWPSNCPQYMYSCTVRVKTDPVYIEKASRACR